MYSNCDYFFDSSGNIYLVRGYLHPPGSVYAKMIYQKDEAGTRLDNFGNHYIKQQLDDGLLISKDSIVSYFKPRQATILKSLSGIWKNIYNSLLNSGVAKEDIGVFGSALVNFPVIRDVDFIVYGVDNCQLIRRQINKIKSDLGFTDISPDHIKYQAQKFGASHNLAATNFEKTLSNKWSTMQIVPGISNTIVFGYREEEVTSELDASDRPGREIIITGIVLDDLYSNFVPRIFKISSAGQIYTIKTLFWAYHGCVLTGQRVKITGKLVDDKVILINDFNHGIWLED